MKPLLFKNGVPIKNLIFTSNAKKDDTVINGRRERKPIWETKTI